MLFEYFPRATLNFTQMKKIQDVNSNEIIMIFFISA